MRRILISICAIAVVASWLFISQLISRPVLACDCPAPESPKKEVKKATAVFVGEVITDTDKNLNRTWIEFKVERFWKGPKTKKITVNSGWGSDCVYLFKSGKKYLIYAYGSELMVGSRGCTRTTDLDSAAADLKELGEGERP